MENTKYRTIVLRMPSKMARLGVDRHLTPSTGPLPPAQATSNVAVPSYVQYDKR